MLVAGPKSDGAVAEIPEVRVISRSVVGTAISEAWACFHKYSPPWSRAPLSQSTTWIPELPQRYFSL